MSAAAFIKGLLDLEGSSLTPILVSLVTKNASMLDAFGKVRTAHDTGPTGCCIQELCLWSVWGQCCEHCEVQGCQPSQCDARGPLFAHSACSAAVLVRSAHEAAVDVSNEECDRQ
jgi:hypothetical protein